MIISTSCSVAAIFIQFVSQRGNIAVSYPSRAWSKCAAEIASLTQAIQMFIKGAVPRPYCFIWQKLSTESTVLDDISKTGSDGAVLSGVNALCPSSSQCYMDQGDRTSGLGGTTRQFFKIN